MSGGDFHEYKGPLVNFSGFCFVCADKPKYGIRVKNSVRVLGVCEKHSQLLYQLKVKGKTAVAVNFTGAPKEVVRKKTLGEAMAETEAEWAAEDAKKG